ncbi:hypothetical protein BV25DRAFT_1922293 [Artomyces pyxidatus]|uniref:Uncharacterized protein n=1 Tax=Artomyces pyxidatus TaxID=48021 RepID=A0ACB8SGG4_9AGAM|nr:hypothetical protein BV25DRAFT_1922293 [Artomyces pyxidatus]
MEQILSSMAQLSVGGMVSDRADDERTALSNAGEPDADLHCPNHISSSLSREGTLEDILYAGLDIVSNLDAGGRGAIIAGLKPHVRLLDHQVQGVTWMASQEQNRTLSGGILADGMGMGKTLQILARVVEDRRNLVESGWMNPGPTLVVCPAGLISQWASEIASFVVDPTVLQYHGSHRETDPTVLERADFVITSYGTISAEHDTLSKASPGKKATVLHIAWRRVVLDEAHRIKNWSTKVATACCEIKADFRWCLTGTPFQNRVDDLYSYIRFLRFAPLDNHDLFRVRILQPFQKGRVADALTCLRFALRSILLRRGKNIISLPPRTVHVVKCRFQDEERTFYDALETKLKSDVREAGACTFSTLLRLRQACCHERILSEDVAGDVTSKTLATNRSECDACGIFCSCDDIVDTSTRVSSSRLTRPNADAAADSPLNSTKVRKVVELLRLIQLRPGCQKTVIFSQFLGMLDILGEVLSIEGFGYVRYDGAMAKSQREDSLRRVRDDEDVTCILISFHAGCVGLNLTACCNVIMTDPWWNPALEEQAFDRVHRVGQTKDVNLYKLVVDGTVEERIINLQERKRAVANRALSQDSLGGLKLTKDDMGALLRPIVPS